MEAVAPLEARRRLRSPAGVVARVVLVAIAVTTPFWMRAVFPRPRYVAAYERERYEKAMQELGAARDDRDRYYALGDAAKTSVFFGSLEQAEEYATELLELAHSAGIDWNFGNAVHDGHVVLGLVALRRGDVVRAEQELLLAGETPGSPQLGSFGPNMTLAKELLEHREAEAVIEYFDLCRRFWKMHTDKLDRWTADARAGRAPDFGANLIH